VSPPPPPAYAAPPVSWPLSSPGDALSARAGWEHSLAGVVRREMRRWLAEVERAALASDPGATALTASGREGFSWRRVVAPWGLLARAVVEHVAYLQGDRAALADLRSRPYDESAPYATPTPGSPYLSGVYDRIMESPAPRLAMDTATLVLAIAAERLWSLAKLSSALADALDPRTGAALARGVAPIPPGPEPAHPFTLEDLTVRRDSWAAMPELMARAEATSAYNTYALDQLSRAGFTHKRWVTRHDEKVRPTHAAAEGQTVPAAGEFLVGGFSLRYPADPTAPAVETAGCRCVLIGTASTSS